MFLVNFVIFLILFSSARSERTQSPFIFIIISNFFQNYKPYSTVFCIVLYKIEFSECEGCNLRWAKQNCHKCMKEHGNTAQKINLRPQIWLNMIVFWFSKLLLFWSNKCIYLYSHTKNILLIYQYVFRSSIDHLYGEDFIKDPLILLIILK